MTYHKKTLIYEHFHVPSGDFINSPRTRGKLKTEFVKEWLAKTAIKNHSIL